MICPLESRKIERIARLLLIFLTLQISVFARADLVVVNADIRTLDGSKPRAEALAVTQNRITAVGDNRQIRRLIGESTKVVDAGGKLVVPGFIDAHVHFAAMGTQFFSIDLRAARTPQEMVEKIKFHARFLPKGFWILGSGWNHENWTPNALPTAALIDEAAPENPVFLYHADARRALVNSLALRAARIGSDAADGAGDEIVRGADGAPTGILKDSAMKRVRSLAPQFSTGDKRAALETASNYAAAYGVTSVHDLSADDNAEIYRRLARDGKLKTRVYDCIALSDWRKLAQDKVNKADGDAMLRRGCLKGAADGDAASSARLYDDISAADDAGLQIMIHAVGARANAQILSIFERVVKTRGKKDRRFRIEHAHSLDPEDVRRFAGSGIIASMQPFLFSDEAGRTLEPLRDFIKAGAPLAFGSDSAMISVDPLAGIAAAVRGDNARRRISVEEAVRFYTAGSAFAEFQENEKGALAVGKLADFVVLSDDIFTVGPDRISRTRVLATFMDGRLIYSAGEKNQ